MSAPDCPHGCGRADEHTHLTRGDQPVTFRGLAQLPLDLNPAPPKPVPFRGDAYVSHLDGDRLETQLGRILRFMLNPPGIYRTVEEIRHEMEGRYPDARWPENSIQAQLRNAKSLLGCRKAKRRRGEAKRGFFEFALWPPEEKA